jgi:nucleoside-diphosphate-sugar epimerase
MKVVVLGATGNIGTAVVERFLEDEGVTEVVGVARRTPYGAAAKPYEGRVRWEQADVRDDRLADVLGGADAVVHLAWMFQPAHRPEITWDANVRGTARVLEAVADAETPCVVVASSIAAYSPAREDAPVEESWPTHGASAAAYAREKAYVERLLDAFESTAAGTRVVRMRPAFVFQRRAASEQRRIFAGPLVPQRLVRPGLIPAVPLPRDLRLQAVHAADVADAIVRSVAVGASGAFNVCADDVVTSDRLAELVNARRLPTSARILRGAMSLGWKARAIPADPRLFDALLRLPVMSNQRARSELSWAPTRSAVSVLEEFLTGVRERAGHDTEPLHPA